MSSRRERIARLGRIGFIANRTAQELAAAEPVAMPAEVAERVQELLQAARDVAGMAEAELLVLEGTRDWEPA